MKKILALFAALILVASAAVAEVDLSVMSFDELVELAHQVDQAIWASDGWQEVTVPPGTYKVGEDIPARKWTITAADGVHALVYYCKAIDAAGEADIWSGSYKDCWLYSPNDPSYTNEQTVVTIEMNAGMFFVVKKGNVVFTPDTGKSSLGFK